MLREVPRSFVVLRSRNAQTLAERIAAAAQLVLPTTAGAYSCNDDCAAYWLAPDEWLLAFADDETELARLLGELVDAAVDVTGGYVMFNLSGAFAGEILKRSTPYDCHPRAFPPGRCAATVFAKTTALIAAAANGSFDLVVRSSYASYVERWMAAAGDAYGIAFETRRRLDPVRVVAHRAVR